LGADKVRAAITLCEEAGSTLSDATAYADSFLDLPLLLKVRRPVAVRPDNKLLYEAKARGWEVLGAAPDHDPRPPQGRPTPA
ncbi:MAG: HAD-IB family hydrolase, partial [Gammaproteobacteria bacterium]|nr:HAD-IB family hydrolase [Gammaproteobacteria bacterium]